MKVIRADWIKDGCYFVGHAKPYCGKNPDDARDAIETAKLLNTTHHNFGNSHIYLAEDLYDSIAPEGVLGGFELVEEQS
jgi:hypothetical protein